MLEFPEIIIYIFIYIFISPWQATHITAYTELFLFLVQKKKKKKKKKNPKTNTLNKINNFRLNKL